jgi:hypothetical protein
MKYKKYIVKKKTNKETKTGIPFSKSPDSQGIRFTFYTRMDISSIRQRIRANINLAEI